MRGKTRAATRFSKFKNDMIIKFKDDQSVMTEFIAFLREMDQTMFEAALSRSCDKDENLFHLESGSVTSVYQILRMIDRPVLLRELEVLAEHIWGKKGKIVLYTAISVLYGVNLIDYKLRDFNSTPSNVVQLFIKEEE